MTPEGNEPRKVRLKADGTKERYLIIGGGELGQNLMRDLPNSVLIESGPVKVYWLTREFGAERVVHGDGSNPEYLKKADVEGADVVIVTIAKDRVNYKIATALREFKVKKVMVRVEDEEAFKTYREMGMEPFKITPAMSAKLVERILKPETIHIHEFILPSKCEAIGKRVEEMDLPEEIKLVSVLRGDHLEIPEPNLVLRVGDVVTVMASEEEVLKLRSLLGARLDLNPLQKIVVPFQGKETIKLGLREAFVLAKHANATVTLLYDKGNKEHAGSVKEVEQMFKLQNVDIDLKGIDGEIVDGLKGFLRSMEDGYDDEIKREGVHFDIVVMDPPRSNRFQIFTGRTRARALVEGTEYPIILAGNMKSYRSMLLLIDASERSDIEVSLAIDLAILFGSKVHVLIVKDEDPERVDRLAKYIIRAGRLYGLTITTQYIEGNPTLEFVENLKSDKYDLVVLNWKCRTMKRDIIRRTAEYGPRSVLIIP